MIPSNPAFFRTAPGMKDRTLIVFYSATGTSRSVARVLASQQGWPCGEIFLDSPRAGPLGTLRSMADSWLRLLPAIRYMGPRPRDFATVVLVAPIWLEQLASPMRTFVHEHAHELRHVAVIAVRGRSGAGNAVAESDMLLGLPPVMTLSLTALEVREGTHAPRLEAFGQALQGMSLAGEPARPFWLSPSSA